VLPQSQKGQRQPAGVLVANSGRSPAGCGPGGANPRLRGLRRPSGVLRSEVQGWAKPTATSTRAVSPAVERCGGPLSGKTIMAVVVWLVAWAILHAALRTQPYQTRRALVVSLVLIALGVLGCGCR
jgi:hypothetical protein